MKKIVQSGNRFLLGTFMVLITVTFLLAGLFVLYHSDQERHYRIMNTFGEAAALKSRLNENILRSRTFLLNNYDPIAASANRLQQICILLQTPRFLSAKVNHALQDYCGQVDLELQNVESFKSFNSVLKNSIQYIPTLLSAFETSKKYEALADDFYVALFQFYANPIHANRTAVMDKSFWLKDAIQQKKFREPALAIEGHFKNILHYLDQRTAVEKQLFSEILPQRLNDLQEAYFEVYTANKAQDTRIQYGLLLLCFSLATGLIWIVFRLNKTRLLLFEFNQTLEQKVNERTQELTIALQKLSENQHILSQSMKMSALGEMAGGIAHEVNTPLAAILLTAESLQNEAKKLHSEELISGLGAIVNTVQRISKIILGLRKFARDGSSDTPKPTQMKQIIEDTLTLCSQKFKFHGIHLQVKCDPSASDVLCVPAQVSQVILNLLNNSFDAVSELPEKWVTIQTLQKEDRMEVSIEDSGGGIPESIREKIMRPLFTTKEIGKGTGLGLSISKGLIEAQGGTLVYDPSSNHTKFILTLKKFDEYAIYATG